MESVTYVFGHKNPDTDSVVSAYALAALKNEAGIKKSDEKEAASKYIAARAGKLSPQTEYIFKKFNVVPPVYLSDLTPKVSYYMSEDFLTIDKNQSLQAASTLMQKYNYHFLAVTDSDGKYSSLLNYSAFAKNLINSLNPEHHIKVFTNHHLIRQSLTAIFGGKTGYDSQEEFIECTILVGASDIESFKKTVDSRPEQKLIVITGDRDDIISYAVEKKAYCIVVSGGRIVSPKIIELAEKNGVNILVSPFDTASTSLLTAYATPVSSISDNSVVPVKESDSVQKVRSMLKKSHDNILPVVNDDNVVVGIITESLLSREPKISVSLVDHNEKGQAVEGIENYRINEIIDHHRIDTMTTKYPVTFINKVVGSTATIIAGLYKEAGITIEPSMAGLLLSGILSDTLCLKSATTTFIDVETAESLAKIAGLDINEFGEEILHAGSRLGSRTPQELVLQDLKEYTQGSIKFTVSQIEVDNTSVILEKKAELLTELEKQRQNCNAVFSALMITDITKLDSLLLLEGDSTSEPLSNFVQVEENVYLLKNIVSRKKQLIPLMIEFMGE